MAAIADTSLNRQLRLTIGRRENRRPAFSLKQALETWKDVTFNYDSTDTADFVPTTSVSA